MILFVRIATSLALLFGTMQLAVAELDDGQRSDLARNYIAHYAAPRFERLQAATSAMNDALGGFCADPQKAGLDDSRSAFSSAYRAWMAVQHIKFGPSLRDDAYFKLQFWPDKHGRGGRQLNAMLVSEKPVPTAEEIAELSAAVQGFPALEQLLFDVEEAAFAGENGSRRCALALSVSENLNALAATLASEWRSYTPEDAGEFVERAYRSYLDMFAVIAELKLKRPMHKSLQAARPKRAEAWRSRLSFAAVAQNLKALGALFEGNAGWPGFRSVLDNDPETHELADSLTQQIAYGADVAGAREETLSEAVTSEEGRRFVDFLIIHVAQIKDTSIELLARPLGVSEGFNALDGD